MKTGRHELAQRKIQKALCELESAQTLIGHACGELAPIIGLVDEWNVVGSIYDKIKDAHEKIRMRENDSTIDVDSYYKCTE